jgi:hypothetical protein
MTHEARFPPKLAPIAIAGMHRSGTSMIARVLSHSGADLGPEENLAPAKADNQDGFCENLTLLEVNNELLAAAGGGWDLPPARPLLETAPDDARAKAIGAFVRFDPARVWAWKDPRNSITLEFWKSLFPDLRVVICLRNPIEVALSLKARNFFSIERGLSLWLEYNERLLEAIPRERRMVTHYVSFFDDPDGEAARLATFAGVRYDEGALRAVVPAVRKELRHHLYSAADLVTAEVAPRILDVYARLCEEAGRDDEAAVLNNVPRREHSGLVHAPALELLQLRRDRVWLTERLAAAEAERDRLGHSQMLRTFEKLRELETTVEQRDAAYAELQAHLDTAVAKYEQRVLQLRTELTSIHTSKLWKLGSFFWRLNRLFSGNGARKGRETPKAMTGTPAIHLDAPQSSK